MKIQAIIGLGNPGTKHERQRHNIGFRVVDALADKYHASWHVRDNMQSATIRIDDHDVLLIKPQTYMNSSGAVLPHLKKKGITLENVVVIHDELELPFGQIKHKVGGSHRGHNGLRSLMDVSGTRDFARIAFGIARPATKEEVPVYVLQNFAEKPEVLQQKIDEAVMLVENILRT